MLAACAKCGKPLPPDSGPNRRYCDPSCRNKAYLDRHRLPPLTRECACGCGESFVLMRVQAGSTSRRYATPACRQRAWAEAKGTEEAKLYRRDAMLRSKYGVSVEQYEEMLKAQDGCCALCNRPPKRPPLHVDHDHETGEVRGLLCVRCNAALGVFGDSEMGLRRVIRYVQRTGEFSTKTATKDGGFGNG